LPDDHVGAVLTALWTLAGA